MSAAFINDGYTAEVTIPALSGNHPAVRFSYRPVTLRERRLIDKEITDSATVDEAMNATCKFVAGRVIKWNIVDGAGNAVPINPNSFDRLEAVLAAQMFNIVRGDFPPHIPAPASADPVEPPKN